MCEDREPVSPARLNALPSFGKPPMICGSQYTDSCSSQHAAATKANNEAVDGDDVIEFTFMVRKSDDRLPITADEIFSDGHIRPLYTANRNLVLAGASTAVGEKTRRPRLLQFLNEERVPTMTTASMDSLSSGDDLEGIPPGTYCLWSPDLPPDRVEKSCSTESLFRWLIRDLALSSSCRSGKRRIVFLAEKKKKLPGNRVGSEGDKKKVKEMVLFTDRRLHYGRKSSLSYIPEIGGCFTGAETAAAAHVRDRNENLWSHSDQSLASSFAAEPRQIQGKIGVAF